jgi:hypothetical protein
LLHQVFAPNPFMSDTPTFANLLTQWSSGGHVERYRVYAHLRENPAEAAALEASIRDELNAALPWNRLIAAEAMIEVYRDEAAATAALSSVLRLDYSSVAADAIPLLEKLSPEQAGPLLVDFALHAPSVFRAQPQDFHQWASRTVIQAGDVGTALWLDLLNHAGTEAESALLVGLANAAPEVRCDLSTVEEAVRARILHSASGYAAGAALWRLTWRVNRDWLATINPESERLENELPLLMLLIEVLTEHLGRRPDLASLVRDLLVRLSNIDVTCFRVLMERLSKLGRRGWSVLLSILSDSSTFPWAQAAIFDEVAVRPAVLALAHHHAHAVILSRETDGPIPVELVQAAVRVLGAIGAPAGSALPHILNLIVKQSILTRLLTPAIPALARGYPNSATAVERTLDRLVRCTPCRSGIFAVLAEVYAILNLDGGPALVENTHFDPRTPALLLEQPAWKNAAPDVRRKHAKALADRLASPRSEVRVRAAELLNHYSDQMPAVWQALVATLTARDEHPVQVVLPYFRQLAPVADTVETELVALFREPNPIYAARAVIALWYIDRMTRVADELRASVENTPNKARVRAVLHGIAEQCRQTPGVLSDLSRVFADLPQKVDYST